MARKLASLPHNQLPDATSDWDQDKSRRKISSKHTTKRMDKAYLLKLWLTSNNLVYSRLLACSAHCLLVGLASDVDFVTRTDSS